jgi:hypothetical protein
MEAKLILLTSSFRNGSCPLSVPFIPEEFRDYGGPNHGRYRLLGCDSGQLYRSFGRGLSKLPHKQRGLAHHKTEIFLAFQCVYCTPELSLQQLKLASLATLKSVLQFIFYIFVFGPQLITPSLGLAGTKHRFGYVLIIESLPVITHHRLFCVALPVHITNEETHLCDFVCTRDNIYLLKFRIYSHMLHTYVCT